MRITLVNTTDTVGGAERCSYDLARGLQESGHTAVLVVGRKQGRDPFVKELPCARWERALRRVSFERLGLTDTVLATPISACLAWPEFRSADVYNVHNMHGGYWNFWTLPILARRASLVLTLHDEWLLTGDCTYSYECDRWRKGCGHCPQALWPDPADRYAVGGGDWTRQNLWLKRKCLQMLPAGRVTVVAPSRWLLERARSSPLLARFSLQQIEHGVDLEVFRPPADGRALRAELGLPQDRFLVFTTASNLDHSRKNFQMIADLLMSSGWPPQCLLVCAGRLDPRQQKVLAGLPVIFLGYLQERSDMARAQGACDVALLAPLADNFPYAALEALACGRPLIASGVGGIPEIVEDGVTGWLLEGPPTVWHLAHTLRRVVETPGDRHRRMQAEARRAAERRFNLSQMVTNYETLFREQTLRSGGKGFRHRVGARPGNF